MCYSQHKKPEKMKISRNLIVLAVLFALAAGYLLRYKRLLYGSYFYQPEAVQERTFPGLTTEQTLMLGGGHIQLTAPKSSYINYPLRKPPGKTRIGIFGCSIVAGDEAAYGDDIASLLQERFFKEGFKDIEVINFGLTARGIHQMYLLWNYIGRKYNLDYVILFPFAWHKWRDNAFTWSLSCYPPIYSRYILQGDDIKLIPVAGHTFKEVYTTYYRLLPPWRYLRYGRRIPVSLRALLPLMLHNRTNPFYYKLKFLKSDREEIFKTYAIIFGRLAKETKNLIIVSNDDGVYSLKEKTYPPNVYFLRSRIPDTIDSFLYIAPLGHNSALGNQLRADELFHFLHKERRYQLKTIELAPEFAEHLDSRLKPLCQYSSISINIDKYPAAKFIQCSKLGFEGIETKDFDFKDTKTASLLLLPDIFAENINLSPSLMLTRKINDPKFLALPFSLNDGSRVFLSFSHGKRMIQIPIGSIDAFGKAIGRIKLDTKGFDYLKNLQVKTKRNNLSIVIGDKVILKGNSISSFKPIYSGFIYLRAGENNSLDIDDLADEGTIDIVMKEYSGGEKSYPVFSYKIQVIR
jgi:hypothetical protein